MGLERAKYICFNGLFVKADNPVLHHYNRGLRYGDAVFESIRTIANQPLFFNEHYDRMLKALQTVKFDHPENLSYENMLRLCEQLLTKNRIFKGGRLRITFFRDSPGNYIPQHNKSSYIIECEHVDDDAYVLNSKGKHLGIYSDDKISINRFSNFKHANSFQYIMAGLYASEHGFDECLLLNENGHLCEAISSNVFIYKKDALFTPSIKEGCVNGIMRQQIIAIAKKSNIPVFDTIPLLQNDLVEADEIFVTNAVKGIQWIVSFRDKRYYHSLASKLTRLLNKVVKERTS